MNMITEGTKKAVEKLLKIERETDQLEQKLEELGISIPGDGDLIEVVADLLGVPPYEKRGDYEIIYCRDWVDSLLFEMVLERPEGEEDYRGFIEEVLSQLEQDKLTHELEEKRHE